jgi:hypothetical protein
MSSQKIEEIFLKYAEIVNLVNKSNIDIEKLTLKQQITAGRHFRTEMRHLKNKIDEVVSLSRALDDDNREFKDNKKSLKD